MRTKTLLVTAALSAAGALASMAQVYSVNIVGYINKSIPTGYSMLANQLNATPDNTLNSLFPAAPLGTFIFKFVPATGGYQADQFDGSPWAGDTGGTMTMNPGEGVFINPGNAFTATFVGEVQLVSDVTLPSGYSIISSVIPQAGNLGPSGDPTTDIPFPVDLGDFIFQFNPATGGYIANDWAGQWEGDNNGAPPSLAVAEAFFFLSGLPQGQSKVWHRTFSVGPP